MIRKENGKYYVYSEDGRRLSKGLNTRKEAEKRFGQIEFFKAKKGGK